MKIILFKLLRFIFFLCPGLCLGLEVRQSLSHVIINPEGEVQIFCSHNKTDYRVILWYQRSPGETAMKLIGYLYFKDSTIEDAYKEDFKISGNLGGNEPKNASLKIEGVKRYHSAVYYCAAREAQ